MLGSTLVTVQTGPKGKLVGRVYVEAYSKVKKDLYASLVIDRMIPAITLLVADTNNEDITALAVLSPDKILRVHLDLITGASPEQIQQVMEFLHLEPKVARESGNVHQRHASGFCRLRRGND